MTPAELKAKFESDWGAFRRFIASNPLTGFWLGVAGGVIGGAVLRGLL